VRICTFPESYGSKDVPEVQFAIADFLLTSLYVVTRVSTLDDVLLVYVQVQVLFLLQETKLNATTAKVKILIFFIRVLFYLDTKVAFFYSTALTKFNYVLASFTGYFE
jgi:hypothetical protein